MKNSVELPPFALQVLERLEERGFEAYAVGGCVRDSLLGRIPQDWDLTTDALPGQVVDCFAGSRVILKGARHGTVGVVVDGAVCEITTYRTETGYSDHRRPDRVAFATSLEKDLARRDFTVNALAYHPRRGVVDCFEGLRHLREKRIVCVGCAQERFEEDALRILRAARFASTLDFDVDDRTQLAALEQRGQLGHIARERVRAEIEKALLGPGFSRVFAADGMAPLLSQVIPEMGRLLRAEGETGLWTRTLRRIQTAPADLPVRIALLFAGSALLLEDGGPAAVCLLSDSRQGADRVAQALKNLRFDNGTVEQVAELMQFIDVVRGRISLGCEQREIRRWLHQVGPETFGRLIAMRRAWDPAQDDQLAEVERQLGLILEDNQCWSLSKLAVKGRDLQELGVSPGPRLGAILESLLHRVIEGELPNDRKMLLSCAKNLVNAIVPPENSQRPRERERSGQ